MDYFWPGCEKETSVILRWPSLQSVMGFAESTAEAYQALADNYTVYVSDSRKELPDTYTVYDMAQDTALAFNAPGITQVSLSGSSNGGTIAMEIAIEYPDKVKKPVPGSTSACMDGSRHQMADRWIQMAKAGEKKELYPAFGEAFYPYDVFEPSHDLLTGACDRLYGQSGAGPWRIFSNREQPNRQKGIMLSIYNRPGHTAYDTARNIRSAY